MKDVVVIGAGFWGSACFERAREKNLDVVMIDSSEEFSSSPNATGICSLSWYEAGSSLLSYFPEHWTTEKVLEEFEWLKDFAQLKHTGYDFHNKMTDGKRWRDDCYLLHESSPILDRDRYEGRFISDRVGRIERLGDRHYKVLDRNGNVLAETAVVVLAAGVWTDRILTASGLDPVGVEPLAGRAFIVGPGEDHELRDDMPLKVMSAPYQFTWIRAQYGGWRTGDSVEEIDVIEEINDFLPLEESEKYRKKFLNPIEERTEDYEILREMRGLRPSTDTIVSEEVSPGLFVATGGGRIGLALSGLVSREASEVF